MQNNSQSHDAQNPDEIFDIVDEHDIPVGRAKRSFIHANHLFHRSSHAIFFDKLGRILLQKRSLKKDSHPGIYTTSCSGHVDSGETYDEALLRETREELGVDLPLSAFKKIGKVAPSTDTEFEFMSVYTTQYEGAFIPSPTEVDSLEWICVDDFERAIKLQAEKFTPSFIKAYEFYKSYLKELPKLDVAKF